MVLCLQLPFAVVPLMLFAGDRVRLGTYAAPRWQMLIGWATTLVIIVLNLKLLWDTVAG